MGAPRLGVLAALFALVACAPPRAGSPSRELWELDGARSRRVSSTAPEDPSNRDNRWVKPGETFTLADLQGPGVIRHIWLTFAEARPNWLAKEGAAAPNEIALRMYWDGAAEPAVEAPLGDFFAAGFGERAEVRSEPIIVQGGDSYNSFWAMPFHRSAKITVTNESARPFAALYYQVDWTEEEVPADAAYFCAQYRQEFPTILGRNYLVCDAEGEGRYVGTVMSVRTRSPEWFGEGDDQFWIDGEEKPSIRGTGTEDYFLNAWGLEKGTFPYFGVSILEGEWGHVGQRLSAYRWHLKDPVCFRKSLVLRFEHYGWMSADETKSGKIEGFVEREDDFATVAFWYQKGQPKRFAKMPPVAERVIPNLDFIVEGKDLAASAKSFHGAVSLQKGWDWTGEGQLFFDAKEADAWVEVQFEVKEAARKRLVVPLTHSYDFGIYRVSLDGKPIGDAIDFYSAEVAVHELSLGDQTLPVGAHTIRFECVGKNSASRGYKLGIDSVRLRQRYPAKR
jgi:hypothetical protein